MVICVVNELHTQVVAVWYAVAILALVVVIGFAGAGYEINHLRTEINTLNAKVNGVSQAIAMLYQAHVEAFRPSQVEARRLGARSRRPPKTVLVEPGNPTHLLRRAGP